MRVCWNVGFSVHLGPFSSMTIVFPYHSPALRTYVLQFFPPAKPHAGRVVLLPHGCYYGAHWRPRGCDTEPRPLSSQVLASRRPAFPP